MRSFFLINENEKVVGEVTVVVFLYTLATYIVILFLQYKSLKIRDY
ncbi:hypothetical protein HMPREF1040_0088 [Megasphaera sp. UPII 135-E]|nr:hypothetical protein HMPREF1040_0088 [Megasphaera sp. UPII 135-E]